MREALSVQHTTRGFPGDHRIEIQSALTPTPDPSPQEGEGRSQRVGWVEHRLCSESEGGGDTHHDDGDGFREGLNPSYDLPRQAL
jgi:hypothetical protein